MTFKKKIMAITPFISLILFFVLRYILKEIGSDDKLRWTWLIFLLNLVIPVVLGEWKINISYPLITVVIYLILGLCFDLWHPGWVVFLLIPIVPIFLKISNIFLHLHRAIRIGSCQYTELLCKCICLPHPLKADGKDDNSKCWCLSFLSPVFSNVCAAVNA